MAITKTTSVQQLEQVVDTARYPLSAGRGPGWRQAVSRVRRELHLVGCSVLPGFVRAEQVEVLRAECAGIAPSAHYETEVVNAYNIAADPALPADHPARISMERGNAFVASDQIPAEAIITRLYTNDLFQDFVADCFALPTLHPLADPLSGLVLNVVSPGMSHPWHFDTNEFTVSMLTQEPDSGGVFEYCPNIRSAREENFTDVAAVLGGPNHSESAAHLIRRLPLRPGDLQLFTGRYSLHRVTEVEGERQRHSAIFAYSERPGVIGSVERTRQLFGRVLPQHHAASVRGDELLD